MWTRRVLTLAGMVVISFLLIGVLLPVFIEDEPRREKQGRDGLSVVLWQGRGFVFHDGDAVPVQELTDRAMAALGPAYPTERGLPIFPLTFLHVTTRWYGSPVLEFAGPVALRREVSIDALAIERQGADVRKVSFTTDRSMPAGRLPRATAEETRVILGAIADYMEWRMPGVPMSAEVRAGVFERTVLRPAAAVAAAAVLALVAGFVWCVRVFRRTWRVPASAQPSSGTSR